MGRANRPVALREKSRAEASLHFAVSRGQSDSWSASVREQYRKILDREGFVVYLNREYRRGCMLERDRFMADHADMLLVVYNGE